MLSTSCKYALRSVVYIMSKAGSGLRLGIKEIADEIGANEHTTAKILGIMAKEGIIDSAKGPTGGFFIMPGGKPIYLIEVVKLIDGDHLFFECGLGLHECSENKPCPIHHSYKMVRETLHKQFCSITVQQLSQDLTLGKAFLKR